MTRNAEGGITLRRVTNALSSASALVASLLVAVLMCVIVTDVARRHVTGRSILGVLEYSEIAMVLIVYLSLGYGQMTRSHVAVDLFLTRLPPRARVTVDTAVLALTALLLMWAAFHTTGAALTSFERQEVRTGLAQVPVWPAKVAIPVGLFAMGLQCVAQVQDNVATLRSMRQQVVVDRPRIEKG